MVCPLPHIWFGGGDEKAFRPIHENGLGLSWFVMLSTRSPEGEIMHTPDYFAWERRHVVCVCVSLCDVDQV